MTAMTSSTTEGREPCTAISTSISPQRAMPTSHGDTWSMATRMTSARLIGRTAELAELDAALSDAAAGHPSLVFLAGESGVGKSRLLAEFAGRARDSGARTEFGDCVALGDEELPYAPIVAILRSLARESDPALDDLSPGARAELATLLPELAGADRPSAPQAPRPSDATPGQARLFEALLSLADRLGRDEPLALVLEDIHWADRSTRGFLTFLARSLWNERVLVVATYRSDELHRRHPLRPLLAELERDSRARRIELVRLTRGELAEQLADILGAAGDDALVERLFERSEGNPLYTEELLAAGLDGQAALPTTLRDALMVRIERLSVAAQELLRLLATGRLLTHDILADASGLPAAELRSALREAAEAHIIVADDRGRYRFRHALLREVVHDDALPGEHAELHLVLARTLEQHAQTDGADALMAAGIAHHYLQAGCQTDALRASVVAAEAAERVHAYGEAAAQLERALDLWARVPDPEQLAGSDRLELLVRAGRALQKEGDYTRAEALLESAYAGLDPGDRRRAVELLEALSRTQWSLGRAEDARATIARAVELIPAENDSPDHARVLAWQAKASMLQGRYGETVPIARQAIAIAERANASGPRSDALNALGIALISGGDIEDGAACLHEAMESAQSDAERCSASVNLADALHLVGRSQEALEVAAAGIGTFEIPGPSLDWLTMTLSEIEWDVGQWRAAREHMPPAGRRRLGMLLALYELRSAEMALATGLHDEARASLTLVHELVTGSREPQFIGWAAALVAELERRAGNLAAARAAVDDALDAIEFCSEDVSRISRVAETGVTVEADAAQRARDLGDDEAERLALLRAEGFVTRVVACVEGWRPIERARLASARAELGRAEGVADPVAYATAVTAWETVGRPYPAALAALRQAEALAAAGRRDDAAEVVSEALATAERLDAGWLRSELEGLAARARLPVACAAGVEPEAAAEAALDPFGLTNRERQVLALVARGATNREIGAELFMAEKTASVHVSRILSKLDVRSRTEAAAVAHRLGLAG